MIVKLKTKAAAITAITDTSVDDYHSDAHKSGRAPSLSCDNAANRLLVRARIATTRRAPSHSRSHIRDGSCQVR